MQQPDSTLEDIGFLPRFQRCLYVVPVRKDNRVTATVWPVQVTVVEETIVTFCKIYL